MKSYDLIKKWQHENDEVVDFYNHDQVKFYLTFDTWEHRFFVESCVGYVNFGLVYFSSQEKAKQCLAELESELLAEIRTQTRKARP